MINWEERYKLLWKVLLIIKKTDIKDKASLYDLVVDQELLIYQMSEKGAYSGIVSLEQRVGNLEKLVTRIHTDLHVVEDKLRGTR